MAQSYTDAAGLRVTEFFTGPTAASNFAAMDQRRAELAAQGATGFTRTSIGRNSTCPCGSGLKFKKCCLHKAVPAV